MSETGRSSPTQGFELDLGRIGLVVIVPVALWAFYTTFEGLKDVTRQGAGDIIGTIGAVVGSAAILTLMALSSWKLGTDAAALLTGRRRSRGSNGGLIVLIPAFLFFLSLSAFFSYTYYHTNFFGLSSRQMEGERQPRALANSVIPLVEDAIRQARERQVERLLASQGAVGWASGIDALSKAAGAGGKRFETLADEATKKVASDESARLKAANTARDQISSIKAQVIEQQRIVKAAGEIIDPQEPEIARLKGLAESETALARAAAGGLDQSKKARCGPICEGHQEKATQARSEANRIDVALKEHRDRRQAAQKKIEDLNLRLPELERIAGTRAPEGTAAATKQGQSTAAALNIMDQVALLSGARESFLKEPSMATVANAGKSCKTLLGTARELNAAGDLSADFDCTIRADDTKLQLEELEKFKREEATYDSQCGLSGVLGAKLDEISSGVRSAMLQPPDGLIEARKLVQQCADLAINVIGRANALDAAYAAMDKFIREQSLDRNRFTNATSHLWKFDSDARLALCVALAQDLLILIYKFLADYYKYSQPRRIGSVSAPIDLSDDEDDPVEIRARKALLRVAKPFRGRSSRISEADIRREQLPEEVEANLRAVLNSLGRKDLVWQAGKEVFGAENDVLHEVEIALERDARSATARGSMTEGEGQPVPGSTNPPAGERQTARPGAVSASPDALQPASQRRPRRSVRDFAANLGASTPERAASSWKSGNASNDAAIPAADQKLQAGRQPLSNDTERESMAPPAHTLDELRKLRG